MTSFDDLQNEQSGNSQIEAQIAQWRVYLRRRQTVQSADVEELEGHLRDQLAELTAAGLSEDEAFLVAVKRMGNLDALSREFARAHSERLWKQLVMSPNTGDSNAGSSNSNVGYADAGEAPRNEPLVVLCLALMAGLAVKVPALFGVRMEGHEGIYLRNASFFAFPLLAFYFLWKRGAEASHVLRLTLPFAAGAALANIFHFGKNSETEVLTILHLPIALWLVIGFAYVRGRWFGSEARMDFVRFSGELFLYYVLIALGGGVFTGFTMMIFRAIGKDAGWLAADWIIPCGAAGAVLVGSWLVEAKQSVIENMAPVLTRLFTPLFTLLLLVFLGTMVWTGSPIKVERDVLIGFDLLLALVVALVLYTASARDPLSPPDFFDGLQMLLIVSALVVDVLALAAIASRISEMGSTPNRVAALGENLILLVNLAWTAWLYARFLRRRDSFAALERWQIAYLPVYSVWAVVVVTVFPLVFRS